MENGRVYTNKYIIRFRDKMEIKQVELCNKGSFDYMVENLEKQGIPYITIKQVNNTNKFTYRSLLDVEEFKEV